MPEAAPPAENPNISKSVVVKATDMDAEMVEAAVRAYEEFRDMARTTGSSGTSAEQEIAAGIRKYFSENPNPKYAGVWHCFVGRNFGAFFTHETGSHIYFYEGQTAVNLFKTA
jgi:dynein light chain LC8-type